MLETKMTFAQWEKKIRQINDTIMIWTTANEQGEVTFAWSANGEEWKKTY